MAESKIELKSDPKYGEYLDWSLFQENEGRPILVADVVHKGRRFVEIRGMFWNSIKNELKFGKGLRIPVDPSDPGNEADAILMAAQAYYSKILGELKAAKKA